MPFSTVDLLLVSGVAAQVGLQPVVTRRFATGVDKSGMVLCETLMKLLICVWQYEGGGSFEWSQDDAWQSFTLAGPPALVYVISGAMKLAGYEHCDGVAFNTINQTKILFSAFFSFVVFGKLQTWLQCLALIGTTIAAAMMSMPGARVSNAGKKSTELLLGVVPTLLAAALSGLAAILCQRALQGYERDSLIFTFELSLWGSLMLLPSLTRASVSTWSSPLNLVPPLTQAVGGILVGLVIKRLGGIAYGFCTVVGILIAAVAETAISGHAPPPIQLAAIPVVIASISLYQYEAL